MTAVLRCDLVLRNARVITLDPTLPYAEAVAIAGDRVVAVGGAADMPPAGRLIDLDGGCVVPGFHDAHNHMAWFGQQLAEIDLRPSAVSTLDQLYAAVAAAAEAPGESWLLGSGYDENSLGRHPDRDGLERVAAGRRVMLRHRSGHMCVVSSAVLAELGLADARRDVAGGRVVVDETGRPTGLLQERAQELANALVLPVPTTELIEAIECAGRRYLAEGITSVVEAGIGGGWIGRSPVELAAYLEAREQARLPVRVEVMVAADALHPLAAAAADDAQFGLDLGVRTGLGDDWLRIGPMKVFCDGSLIGRTAAMTTDFADAPGNRGYLSAPAADLVTIMVAAHRAGWRIAAHAIGDAAIDVALDGIEAALRAAPRTDPRHRIEHFGVARDDQVRRAAALGVVPVPQGRFVGAIGDGMRAALGERVAEAYRLRSLLDAGLVVPGSSDRPVVDGHPLHGIHDMVNRRTESGAPFASGEALTPLEALAAYTLGSAYASHQEHNRGSIRPGLLADLAVLSDSPLTVPAEQLRDLTVAATVVGGAAGYDPAGRFSV